MYKSKKIFVWIVLLFFLFHFYKCKKINITNPGYAIGTINYYESTNSGNVINYTFVVGNQKYFANYSGDPTGEKAVPSGGKYVPGDKYMVQYQNGNIDNENRMLFDYPVMDSAHYLSYINTFKTNPPK